MADTVTINFYNIRKCGYYARGGDRHEFGSIDSILPQLFDWVSQEGFTLEDTCTYRAEDEENVLRTFCCNIRNQRITGDYLLTLWNETPSVDGRVASVDIHNPVGQATVHLNDLEDGTIAGYPTYFWFLPDENVFATVRVNAGLNGHPNMMRFFKGFVDIFSDHVVRDEDPDEDGNYSIVGYRCAVDDDILDNLYPAFHSVPLRNPGELDFIREHRGKIRKLHRKTTLTVNAEEHLDFWQQLMTMARLRQAPDLRQNADVTYALPFTPSGEELEGIIEEWQEGVGTGWDDIGFSIKGEQQPLWLSTSLAKTSREFELEWDDNNAIVTSESLMGHLIDHRDDLLGIIV